MKFKSRHKKVVVRLASTIGDVILVGKEWVDIPEHLEGEAYSKGCISEEMFNTIKEDLSEIEDPVPEPSPELDLSPDTEEGVRNSTIKAVIDAMIDDPKPSDFTARGMPNLAILSERCAFPVPKVHMVPVWDYIQDERDRQEVE